MFQVKLTKECLSRFLNDKRLNRFKREDIANIHAWILEMREFGPKHIKNSSYWRDHTLVGQRWGQRASSFSLSGRIIYKVYNKEQQILVLKISHNHRY